MKATEKFSTRAGFVLAAAGSAVGLGNIWKFPYIAGENGGGAFVLAYLFFIIVVTLPLMIAEIGLGKFTGKGPVSVFKAIGGKASKYQFVGWMGVITALFIMSFYSVVAGWTMDYLVNICLGTFQNLEPAVIESKFGDLYGDPARNISWHIVFMIICASIVAMGVQKGIERFSKILMTALFFLMLFLLYEAWTTGAVVKGLSFVFKPDFSKLTPDAMLTALGHAFFSLSLGMGAMITYGSYLKNENDVVGVSIVVAFLDTLVAIVSCMIIFPIVFTYGFEPSAGPGLVFKTLPVIFSKMALGQLVGTVFFFLLFFAALTSAISLVEVVVRALMESIKISRKMAVLATFVVIVLMGIPAALSGSSMANFKIGSLTYFDFMDYITASWMMPLGGFFVAIFCGWIVERTILVDGLFGKSAFAKSAGLFVFFMKFVVPASMLVIFVSLLV